MANLTPIQAIQKEGVFDIVESAIRDDVHTDLIEDFLASVDWSEPRNATKEVEELLGALEGWTTLFVEGQMTESAYTEKLIQMLPSATARRLTAKSEQTGT